MEDNKKQQKLTTPGAIVIAGVLVMIAILITRGGGNSTGGTAKSLSEQVGVNKQAFAQCLKDTDLQKLKDDTDKGAMAAMSGVPADQRGTPYSVIIGKNGTKAEIRGALDHDSVVKLIDEVKAGKSTTSPYTGNIPAVTADDHITGSIDAPIVIVEYADLECPYCKRFEDTMKQIVSESNGEVAWVYRHWIIHQGALLKTAAAECVAKLKGNDAFWKYIGLTFAEINTGEQQPSTDNL